MFHVELQVRTYLAQMQRVANQLVYNLLEADDPTDDVDPKSYIQLATTATTVADVLKKFGFADRKLNVPLKHTNFISSFDDPKPNLTSNYIEITVDQARQQYPSSTRNDDFYHSFETHADVRFHPQNLYITTSRTVIAGPRGNVAQRLNHVIQFLIEAIHAEDGRHTDLYALFNAIDKRWGKQPNRIVKRRKKKPAWPFDEVEHYQI
jgi:ribosome-associated translation inhibitor RaiA